ncbi:MAG: hypothetical protein JWQ21_2402 [Herminiimonas sp.]|nr:hypothetical protein [Herminiimonas sp.]
MKWYYKWKLRKIQKEISSLKDSSSHPLTDDYTAHSRLRSLNRLAQHLQERLAQSFPPSAQH